MWNVAESEGWVFADSLKQEGHMSAEQQPTFN